MIQAFTREAGVRNVEREIASISRKVARKVASNPRAKVKVKADDLEEYIGPARFDYGQLEEEDQIGIVTGLVVSDAGGDIVQVEATKMDGKDDLILTGQLGSVMQESARAGLSYIRARCRELGLDPVIFEKQTLHIHVPAGATPKDGPSAGVTMATAMASLLTGRPVRRDVAMTGEITLRGRVLPIGGLKAKLLAAHLAGVETVIIPRRNERDLVDVPDDVRKQLTDRAGRPHGPGPGRRLDRRGSAGGEDGPAVHHAAGPQAGAPGPQGSQGPGRRGARPRGQAGQATARDAPLRGRLGRGGGAHGVPRLLRGPGRPQIGQPGRDQEGVPPPGPGASPRYATRATRRPSAASRT